MRRSQTVWVRNNGKEPFSDKFDGEEFIIAPGDTVEMLVECAQLCLGFGDEDKSRVLRRKGWAFTHTAQQAAIARLDAFSFHMSEREAIAHDPNKAPAKAPEATASSSAPASAAEAGGGSLPPATAQKTAHKPGPLEKLAAANAAAG